MNDYLVIIFHMERFIGKFEFNDWNLLPVDYQVSHQHIE